MAIYFLQAMLACVLGVKKFGLVALIIPLPIVTAWYHIQMNKLFARPWTLMNLREAAALDAQEGGQVGGSRGLGLMVSGGEGRRWGARWVGAGGGFPLVCVGGQVGGRRGWVFVAGGRGGGGGPGGWEEGVGFIVCRGRGGGARWVGAGGWPHCLWRGRWGGGANWWLGWAWLHRGAGGWRSSWMRYV